MQFTATPTGSLSIRLLWDPAAQPGGTFKVWRGTTNVFGAATALSGFLPAGSTVYNDYTPAASTTYYYWLQDQDQDQDLVTSGPLTVSSNAASLTTDALAAPQMDALYDWAYGVFLGLYPVTWRYQPVAQVLKPKIVLNILGLRRPGRDDYAINDNEGRVSQRTGTVSVLVSSDPQPPPRALVAAVELEAGEYLIQINDTQYSVTFATPPATDTEVTTALQAKLDAAGFKTMLYGIDPDDQALAIEAADPRADFEVSASDNLTVETIATLPAMTIVQRLGAALSDPAVLDALAAAGIGVGTVNDAQDVSQALETRDELVAQFDFFINVAGVLAVTGPIIDTVTDLNGNVT